MKKSTKGILIGIAGSSGSGKTSVSNNINKALGSKKVVILEQDYYYRNQDHLSLKKREKVNYDHPDAVDMDLMYEQLQVLVSGKSIEHPIYDFKTHTRKSETKKVGPHHIIVLEGILVFVDPRIRELMDIKVYVDNDPDICFIRRLTRDISERGRTLESVIKQYQASVRPMFLQFVEPTKRYADVIIPGGGHNKVGIDLLVTKIGSLLREREKE